ncbi:MAG: hypothetical protein JNM83_04970 [Myxococcales bacterium]|jgi:hypothetical protein|nr:hypothetical protein [Myxococcales bacterium]
MAPKPRLFFLSTALGPAELEQQSLKALEASFLAPERKAELAQAFRADFLRLRW